MDLAIPDTIRATDRIRILTTVQTIGITTTAILGKNPSAFLCPDSYESGQIYFESHTTQGEYPNFLRFSFAIVLPCWAALRYHLMASVVLF